jgi:hypothetical protein
MVQDSQVVWSKGGAGSGQSDVFVMFPPDGSAIAPLLARIRATIHVGYASSNLQTKVVLQSSDDGVSWNSPVDMEAGFVTGNRSTTTAWYANGAQFTRHVRLGVLVQQASGAAVEVGRVTLVIDVETL